MMQSTSITIDRDISVEQLEQVFTLYQQEWPSPTRNLGDLKRATAGSKFVVAATKDGNAVGLCRLISDDGFRGVVLGLVVDTNFRGIGLGRRLLKSILEIAKDMKLHSVQLTYQPTMVPFYTAAGFKIRDEELVMDLNLRHTNSGHVQQPSEKETE